MELLYKGFVWKTDVRKRLRKAVLVELLLLCRHVDAEDLLHLGRERFFHIFLDTSQKEWLEDFVETLITIISPFPMLVFKILPGVKPAVHSRDNKHHSAFFPFALNHFKRLKRDVLVRHEEVQQ